MILRLDRMQIDLPMPDEPDPNGAAAVQELMGGEFGEMSTFMTYIFQSFNFRGREKARPYFDLVANITAEEFGHIELVSQTINIMLNGATEAAPPEEAPLKAGKDARNTHHFIKTAQATLPGNSMGQPWTGDYVFNSGNLQLDLLNNFFLESGARTHKIRVYEMTKHPTARAMIGYLLVRGGVHQMAYAKALQDLTGVNVTKLLPVPDIPNSKFPETRKWEARGEHRKIYRFVPKGSNDYKELAKIWTGTHPTEGGRLEVVDGRPEGAPLPDLPALPQQLAPGVDSDDVKGLAKRLFKF